MVAKTYDSIIVMVMEDFINLNCYIKTDSKQVAKDS